MTDLYLQNKTSLVEALFTVGRQREELNLEAIVDDLREINVIAFPVKSSSGLIVPLYQFDAIMKHFESLRETFEKRKKRVGSYVPPTLQVKEANEELKKLAEAQQIYKQAHQKDFLARVLNSCKKKVPFSL